MRWPEALVYFGLPLFAWLAAMFFGIPQSIRLFHKWKTTQNPRWFSSSIFLGFASLVFWLFFFTTYMRLTYDYETRIQSWLLRLLLFIVLICAAYSVFLPKTIIHFERWKKGKKLVELSLSLFFGTLSFYVLTLIFCRTIILTGIERIYEVVKPLIFENDISLMELNKVSQVIKSSE